METKKCGLSYQWGIILGDIASQQWRIQTSDGSLLQFSSKQLRILHGDGSNPPDGKDPIQMVPILPTAAALSSPNLATAIAVLTQHPPGGPSTTRVGVPLPGTTLPPI